MKRLPQQTPMIFLAVLTLVVVSTWVFGGGGASVDTTAFDEAIADLAVAPGMRYRSKIGGGQFEATTESEFTATGQGMGKTGIGEMTSDMLVVDGRLFTRLPEGMLPDVPGMPAMTGRWVTLNEELGATLSASMTPSALAIQLARMLAEGRGAGITGGVKISDDEIDGTPVLKADTPDGDIFVTAQSPHRVVRYTPTIATGALPTAPSGSMPSIPEDFDPEDLELPEDFDPGDLELPEDLSPTTLPGTQNLLRETTLQQPPNPGTGSGMDGMISSNEIDLTPLSEGELSGLYENLHTAAEELVDAVNSDILYNQGEPAIGDCGPTSCEATVEVEIEHANGRDMPAEVSIAMRANGEEAGECTGTGMLPASGTGSLGCTNASPEWAAAQAQGADSEPSTIASIVAKAMLPEEAQAIADQVALEGEQVDGAFVEDATPTSAVDTQVEKVIEALGLSRPSKRIADLQARVGATEKVVKQKKDEFGEESVTVGLTPDQVLTEAHVADAQKVIARLDLTQIDAASAKKVVERALKAQDRAALYRELDVLRAAADLTTRDDDGSKIFVGVRAPKVVMGEGENAKEFDISTLDLGPDKVSEDGTKVTKGYQLDLLWLDKEGTLQGQQVLGTASELDDEHRAREIERTLTAFPLSGTDREMTLSVLDNTNLDHLFRSKDGFVGGPPPVDALESVVPAPILSRPGVRDRFVTPPRTDTDAIFAVLVNGVPELPPGNDLRTSGGGLHAEVRAVREGDLERALKHAAARGTPENKARVVLVVTRTSCDGTPTSCAQTMIVEWPAAWAQLSDAEKANIQPVLHFPALTPYTPATIDRATTTSTVQAFADHDIAFRVMSVDGNVRKSGQYLVDALKEAKPAPAAQRNAIAVAGANRAGISVRGYRWNPEVTGAVAKATETTAPDPKKLTTMEEIKETLDPALHQQGVCI